MKIKVNTKLGITLILFGLFVFPYILRNHFLPQAVAAINIISWVGFLVFIRKTRIQKIDVFGKVSLFLIAIVLMISVFQFSDLTNFLSTVFSVIIPVAVLCVSRADETKRKMIFATTLKFFDLAAYIISVGAVIDLFSNHGVSKALAGFYNTASLIQMASSDRIVSFYGHSLSGMLIILMYFGLHIIDYFYVSRKGNMYVPTIISIVAITATGSKVGIVCLIFMLMIAFGNKKTIKFVPLVIVAIAVTFYFGLFDLVIERIHIGVEKSDITTGRFTSFIYLYSNGTLSFNFFHGHGSQLISQSAQMAAALENPIMRWAYRNGILYSLCMMTVSMMFPMIRIIRKHNARVIMIAGIILIAENTFDTVCSIGDSMMLTCLFFSVCSLFERNGLVESEVVG